MIKAEFMERYDEWFKDRTELNDHDYGWKYGWQKSEKLLSLKDNLTAVAMFQKYIFSAYRTTNQWKRAGYDERAIWDLCREGFLSMRDHKRETYRFISQKTAKEIYKEARA